MIHPILISNHIPVMVCSCTRSNSKVESSYFLIRTLPATESGDVIGLMFTINGDPMSSWSKGHKSWRPRIVEEI